MVKRRVDNRVKILIENGATQGYRTFFVLVGDKSRDQVVYIHHMLSKASLKQASVLWCYKKNLAFSSHRKKRMKQIKAKQQTGTLSVDEEDPFVMFVSMTEIRYCFYKDTHKILGNTFKMCVIQDFEALTPNMLCRTIETVEGGGIVVLLLESMSSLKQLYALNMDVHSRYRTAAHQHVVPRFNERFILSLATNPACMVMDDQLRILPISSLTRDIKPLPFSASEVKLSPNEIELKTLKETVKETNPIGPLVAICKTLDQAKVVTEFIKTITEKDLNCILTLTAARGRGKSAAMGIALAGAIASGFSLICVTSPSPENLKTLFEFVLKGLTALGYEKHVHYEVTSSANPEHNNAIENVTVTRNERQIIQYIVPTERDLLDNAELVVIDEAAAIPLPQVKALLGNHLVFLASTVSGYEGTGRSLSLKLIDELRQKSLSETNAKKLIELTLSESIRYKDGDHVEKWLNDLLCLESSLPAFDPQELPPTDQCNLFYVNRDTLFGYHQMAENFLGSMMSLLVSSHYRNTPDDLQILSDAPAHHLFVLLPPTTSDSTIPTILCVIQVALEGKISKDAVEAAKTMDGRPAGDLIPWTVSNVFQDDEFPQLSGARIVRIATHPEAQGKGYGSRAIALLEEYYQRSASKASTTEVSNIDTKGVNVVDEEEVGLLNEAVAPQEEPQPLLLSMAEREPEALHYLGVSFGATQQLLRFWKKSKFSTIYLSQLSNKLTGENSCLMLKTLGEKKQERDSSWLRPLWFKFRSKMLTLLPGAFEQHSCKFAISIITNSYYKNKGLVGLSKEELETEFSTFDFNRLKRFVENRCESSAIADLVFDLGRVFFLDKIPKCKLKAVESAILAGVGLQKKLPKEVAIELGLEKDVFQQQYHSVIEKIFQSLNELRIPKSNEESVVEPAVSTPFIESNKTDISLNSPHEDRILRLMNATKKAAEENSEQKVLLSCKKKRKILQEGKNKKNKLK